MRGYLGVKEQAGNNRRWTVAQGLFSSLPICVKSELSVLSKRFHPVSLRGNSFVGAVFAMAMISLHWE